MKLILAFVLLLSSAAFAQDQRKKVTPEDFGAVPVIPQRYQIVSTNRGAHSVFRVDTVTGEVSYCFAINRADEAAAFGVRCVPQVK